MRGRLCVFGVSVAVAAAVAGCGGSGSTSSSQSGTTPPGTSTSTRASIKPPPSVAAKGAIHFCTDPTLGPPASYVQNGQHLGSDMNIARTIAAEMGVKADITTISFNTVIPSIESGQCDAYIGGMSDTPARAKQVHFTDYAKVGDQILVPKGNPHHVHSLESLSGLTVAVVLGATEGPSLEAVNKQDLGPAGKKPIVVRTFEGGSAANEALLTGQVDATDQSFPALLAYVATSAGRGRFQFALPHQVDTFNWAIASSKTNSALGNAFKEAVDQMYKDGSMRQILTKAGLADTLLQQ